MAPDTFYTIFPPFRTAAAVKASENKDFINLDSSNRKLYAAHPVSMSWLRAKLSPEERQDMLRHIGAVPESDEEFPVQFSKAIRETLNRLETIKDEEADPKAARPTYATLPIPPFRAQMTPEAATIGSRAPGSMPRIDEEAAVDDLNHQFGSMGMSAAQDPPMPPASSPRRARHGRTTSCIDDFQGVGHRAWGEDEAQAPLPTNNKNNTNTIMINFAIPIATSPQLSSRFQY